MPDKLRPPSRATECPEYPLRLRSGQPVCIEKCRKWWQWRRRVWPSSFLGTRA